MSLSLIPDDDHRTASGQVTCAIGKKLVFGRNEIDKEDKKLSKFVARLEAMDAESARITRVGRTAMHVIPKGETGTLTMCKEGEENGREKSTEVMWLGDQVVMVGSKKHTFVLLPQGKTWFQWAEQHREEQEHRLLELRGIGGQSLTEEELARKDELKIKIARRKEEDEARTEELRKRQVEEAKTRPDAVEGVEDEKGEQSTSKRKGILSASDHAGLPPPPPASTSALSAILGEDLPEFQDKQGAGSKSLSQHEDFYTSLKPSLLILGSLEEGDKVCVEEQKIRRQSPSVSGGFSRFMKKQSREVTVEWARTFNRRVRSHIEKSIIAVEEGNSSVDEFPAWSRIISDACRGLENLRRTYSGDLVTQEQLKEVGKEMLLSQKLLDSFFLRSQGRNPRLNT
uniref:Uncharacterized protein n=1 Tax=Guillardia theta TaxID=55529 RepID=A0A7S4PPW5_GUITH|mmetsp:Transcript_8409/g.28215  ORF Transcript_8409/g.28215 Transcript_8409/m.28215 type:complete len:399 (+) Transcript_8409:38-1234(+)